MNINLFKINRFIKLIFIFTISTSILPLKNIAGNNIIIKDINGKNYLIRDLSFKRETILSKDELLSKIETRIHSYKVAKERQVRKTKILKDQIDLISYFKSKNNVSKKNIIKEIQKQSY